MSQISNQPATAVKLQIDAISLRQQLRHAFANAHTVVQELIQNSRRAGATRVLVDYDEQTQVLAVTDDGCGIADFQVLLTFAASGWDANTMASELPYGIGWMAALYAGTQAEITSRGKVLAFDTAGMLADKEFALVDTQTQTPGTRIVLQGVTLRDAHTAMHQIARGYSIPIVYNGDVLGRPDANDMRQFLTTDVGQVSIEPTYRGTGHTVVYLQGFQVLRPHNYPWTYNVVHLDGAKFRGKFPDRDRVIDEHEMVQAVEQIIKRLYEDKLTAMKATLASATFCREAYNLATSLNRLDIFNDVPTIPGEWLATVDQTPRSCVNSSDIDLIPCKGDLDRSAIEAGDIELVDLHAGEGFEPLDEYDDGQTQLLWLYAYATQCAVLDVLLKQDHWLFEAARKATGAVSVEATTLFEGRIPWARAAKVGGDLVRLCSDVHLRCGERRVPYTEAFATRHEGDTAFLVPCEREPAGAITPAIADWDTLRQASRYVDDNTDNLDESALDVDEQEVNQAVRNLLAKSPLEHAQQVLTAALRGYAEELKLYSTIAVEVDGDGRVNVKTCEPALATAA
jgi:Histidine kinase-, DNA gyrase B-, and HSP90-like ATPase